jgi:hypothetical protein
MASAHRAVALWHLAAKFNDLAQLGHLDEDAAHLEPALEFFRHAKTCL